MRKIQDIIGENIRITSSLLDKQEFISALNQVVDLSVRTFQQQKKMLFCGNGGSAADAQHIAAELSGKFKRHRPALYAEALHVNTSFLTAVANDYGYEQVFARAVEAQGQAGDVLVAISTSGNSPNILLAAETAKKMGLTIVGMTGKSGGKLVELCDHCLQVPATDTARIQECHILTGHILCEQIEEILFS